MVSDGELHAPPRCAWIDGRSPLGALEMAMARRRRANGGDALVWLLLAPFWLALLPFRAIAWIYQERQRYRRRVLVDESINRRWEKRQNRLDGE